MVDGIEGFTLIAHYSHGVDLLFGVQEKMPVGVCGGIMDGVTLLGLAVAAGNETADFRAGRALRLFQNLVDERDGELDGFHIA